MAGVDPRQQRRNDRPRPGSHRVGDSHALVRSLAGRPRAQPNDGLPHGQGRRSVDDRRRLRANRQCRLGDGSGRGHDSLPATPLRKPAWWVSRGSWRSSAPCWVSPSTPMGWLVCHRLASRLGAGSGSAHSVRQGGHSRLRCRRLRFLGSPAPSCVTGQLVVFDGGNTIVDDRSGSVQRQSLWAQSVQGAERPADHLRMEAYS